MTTVYQHRSFFGDILLKNLNIQQFMNTVCLVWFMLPTLMADLSHFLDQR